MTSTIVPPVDLAPGMPSRVVTISATDVTEGGQSLEGQVVRFALSDTLDITSGGDVIAKTQAEVVLDSNGEGRIRLPVYDSSVKTWCGKDWAILVTATWGSQKAIRVPAGTGSIALSALPNIRPLRGRELQWAVTGASVSVTEGAQWDASVSLSGGVLDFDFTVPPGATAYWRGTVSASIHLDDIREPGVYGIRGTAPGRPAGAVNGTLTVSVPIVFTEYAAVTQEWQNFGANPFKAFRFFAAQGWSEWMPAGNAMTVRSTVPGGAVPNWYGLSRAGVYRVPTQSAADAISHRPHGAGPGTVTVTPVDGTTSTVTWVEFGEHGRVFERTVSDVGANATGWVQRAQPTRFGTALTCATGSSTTSTATNVGHALPYTPGARVDRWRLHLRNFNDRSGTRFDGSLAIAGISVGEMQRTEEGLPWGAWKADGARKNIVPNGVDSTPAAGGEYVTPWVDDFPLEAMQDYVIRYGYTCEPQDNHLAQGGGWSLTAGASDVNSTNPAMTQEKLAPLDVWIEGYTEAGVKIIAGFGDSLTVGQSASLPVYDSWLSKVARSQGAMPMFYAHSGTGYSEWTNAGAWKFHKYNNETFYRMTTPSLLYCAMGSNDVFGSGVTLAQMIDRFNAALPLIKAKTTQNVVFTTVLPRHDPGHPQEVVRREWNDWLRDNAGSHGLYVVDVAAAVTDRSGHALDPRWSATTSDIHLSTAGYARIAAAITTGTGPPPVLNSGVVGAAGLLSEFTSTTSGVTLQRIGPHCEFSVRARRFDKAGVSAGTVLCTLPAGYRPSALYRDALVTHPGAQVDVDPSGTVTLVSGTIAQDSYVTLRLVHLTTDPAPVS